MRILIVEPSSSRPRGDQGGRRADPDRPAEALTAALLERGAEVRRLPVRATTPVEPRGLHCGEAGDELDEVLASFDPGRVVLVDPRRLPADLGARAGRGGRAVLTLGAGAEPADPQATTRPDPARPGAAVDAGPRDPAAHPDLALALSHASAAREIDPSASADAAAAAVLEPACPPTTPPDDDLFAAAEHLLADHLRVARWAAELAQHAADLEAPPTVGSTLRRLRRRAVRIVKRLR